MVAESQTQPRPSPAWISSTTPSSPLHCTLHLALQVGRQRPPRHARFVSEIHGCSPPHPQQSLSCHQQCPGLTSKSPNPESTLLRTCTQVRRLPLQDSRQPSKGSSQWILNHIQAIRTPAPPRGYAASSPCSSSVRSVQSRPPDPRAVRFQRESAEPSEQALDHQVQGSSRW